MAKFAINTALLAAILSGATTHVGKTEEIGAHIKEGLIEVNTDPASFDANGNAPVRLTEKGKAAAPASGSNVGTADNSTLFAMATMVDLPSIKRGGNTVPRESKYPLKDIPLGGGLFIVATVDKDKSPDGFDFLDKAKRMSKQFGSMIAEFNKAHPDKFITSRTVEDGKAAGFSLPGNPDAFAGKPGIGIFHRPVAEREAAAKAKADRAAAKAAKAAETA